MTNNKNKTLMEELTSSSIFLNRVVESTFLHKFSDYVFAQNFYAALCNTVWVDSDNREYRYSWRSAGKFVSSIRRVWFSKKEDYLDYYCSGMKSQYRQDETILVEEGIVTPEISECMEEIGLILIECLDIYEDAYFSDISLC